MCDLNTVAQTRFIVTSCFYYHDDKHDIRLRAIIGKHTIRMPLDNGKERDMHRRCVILEAPY